MPHNGVITLESRNMFIEFIFYILLGPILFLLGMALKLFSSVPILFYQGLIVSVLSAVIQFFLALIRFPTRMLTYPPGPVWGYLALSAASLGFAFNVTFLIVFPVTFDRSVTTYLLETLSASSEGLSKQELEDSLVDDYVKKQAAVDRRMLEQIYSKNVVRCGEKFCLTEQGQTFMKFEGAIKSIFGISVKTK